MSGFHGAFATGVASQQGTLTLPDTWFPSPFWDLLMLQLFRPNSSNLPCLYSTFHLEYPLVLSRFCFAKLFVLFNSNNSMNIIGFTLSFCSWGLTEPLITTYVEYLSMLICNVNFIGKIIWTLNLNNARRSLVTPLLDIDNTVNIHVIVFRTPFMFRYAQKTSSVAACGLCRHFH